MALVLVPFLFDTKMDPWLNQSHPSYFRMFARGFHPENCIESCTPRLVIYKPPGWEVDTTISAGSSGRRLLSAFLCDVLRQPLGAAHQFGFLHRLDLPSSLDWVEKGPDSSHFTSSEEPKIGPRMTQV